MVSPGYYQSEVKVPNPLLKEGKYLLKLYAGNEESGISDYPDDSLSFEIEDYSCQIKHPREGFLFQNIEWEFKKL